ncbi:MAG: S-methyl-5-thioribose-1-phosphate isomerase [Bacteroidales bacterium]|nr:MAG: S-methyl-5-thioribose-1-phosphate isomerase [Bacteroidales bacterium]
MKVNNKYYRSIWLKEKDPSVVLSIDQRKLPFEFHVVEFKTVEDIREAIENMTVRGAPLIGVAAAYGMYLAAYNQPAGNYAEKYFSDIAEKFKSARPTAVNLALAVNRSLDNILDEEKPADRLNAAMQTALELAEQETGYCQNIGRFGLPLIEKISKEKAGATVNILTHCNAGWLACVDYGTATAPIYFAHEKGIKVHVWVDETRPRNQGARLTVWELSQQGIPNTLVTDNAGGMLMQQGKVDIVLVGSDRTTITGDVANKIGTYLKALAAKDNNVPFYVALPSTSIDPSLRNGLNEIPIEKRSGEEVEFMEGMLGTGLKHVRICEEGTNISNLGFDITPARLVSGLITERGICQAKEEDILKLFPEFSDTR